jgi:hypothetical protein
VPPGSIDCSIGGALAPADRSARRTRGAVR